MELQNAALLALVVYVGVEFAKRLLPGEWLKPVQVVPALTLVLGIAAVFVVAETVWAHNQIISGKPLDELDAWSKVVTGVFLAAGAVGIHKGLSAVKSVGQTHPDEYK